MTLPAPQPGPSPAPVRTPAPRPAASARPGRLSAEQIAQAAFDAGLRSADNLAVAVAIALAESGGNPRAHNSTPPDDSYGLWQINMLGGMGPERRRALGITTNDALYDPAVNAKAMMLISRNGKFWSPWTTFTRGAYLRHLAAARAGVTQPVRAPAAPGSGRDELLPDTPAGEPDSVLETAQQGLRRITAAGDWLADRHNWLRVAYVGYGGAMLVAALLIAGRKPLGKLAGGVPVGRIAKAAGKAGKAAKAAA